MISLKGLGFVQWVLTMQIFFLQTLFCNVSYETPFAPLLKMNLSQVWEVVPWSVILICILEWYQKAHAVQGYWQTMHYLHAS